MNNATTFAHTKPNETVSLAEQRGYSGSALLPCKTS
jgi:hypothetical protein